ncbi:hypothetical protein CH260_24080 [Rhodococcus sp. 05-2256-B2]|uniref:hypothetical protein n=1 Tax=unclassified Rhodococcus (in: high G+C Gram-positive bacteria) TaxID=192944 RepID=UPI000B9C26A9|nr:MULTISPECIES: hypothetical protein [unclassified Rhodococcus (in: high G+C Gram-positive bacteria)]OZD86503.1 hypothetical protein CH257_26145 [Rhodococcus sp. 05-2256-B3]OZD90767.1 hypothetical protein CH260_24080 [Rhodococcus sp. 05-2256-B2]OZD94480.1 hypothetical protein CH258_00300 [Rhodococcus sp. 05-2256-B4]OZE07184.1 hypothetical protein CH285_04960 [Rhodococcus sp. 05-2256-B1]
MYDEPEYRYFINEYGTAGKSTAGEIKCFSDNFPGRTLGHFTFGVFDDIRVVETLQLNNRTKKDDHPGTYLGGLGMAMFQRLMARYPGYEFRTFGPLKDQTEAGQRFITAVRNGDARYGRDPLPYHENGCFNGREECVCPLGGRQRDQ